MGGGVGGEGGGGAAPLPRSVLLPGLSGLYGQQPFLLMPAPGIGGAHPARARFLKLLDWSYGGSHH
jgi:hypothetical protein